MPSGLASFGCGPTGACDDEGAAVADGPANRRGSCCSANLGRLLAGPGDDAVGASVESAEVRGDSASSSALAAERFDPPRGEGGDCRGDSQGGSEDEWAWDEGVS